MNLQPSLLWLLPVVLAPAAMTPGCSSEGEGTQETATGSAMGMGGPVASRSPRRAGCRPRLGASP
jgi:hypothetical protein